MKFLLECTSDLEQRNKLIHDSNDQAFCDAAPNGHIGVMRLLLEYTLDPSQRNKMIHANNDQAFCDAAWYGHIEIMKFLLELIPEQVQRDKMIHCDNDKVFKDASGDTSKNVGGYCGYYKYNGGPGYGGGYGKYEEKDGNEKVLNFFLELDPDYFENLAQSLKITSKTAVYIAKTAQEIRETKAHNTNVLAQYEGSSNKLAWPSSSCSTTSKGVLSAQKGTASAVNSSTALSSDSVLAQGSTPTTPLASGVALISNVLTDRTQHTSAYLQQQIINQNDVHEQQ